MVVDDDTFVIPKGLKVRGWHALGISSCLFGWAVPLANDAKALIDGRAIGFAASDIYSPS
jgi:hypothetical protein